MKTPNFLAIDNCFASKRWTEPMEWMRIAADAGIGYIEASADTECDSLYSDPDYLKDWIRDVRRATAETGVRIANLYSGHGTYTTLGLAHPDSRNARRMEEEWLGGMLIRAAELQCGVGFFCHAFPQSVLQDPAHYQASLEMLYDRLAHLAVRAAELGVPEIGVEQMYSPHQVPWTIEGARTLVHEVWKRSGKNFYLTIDTGHQSGQQNFRRPDAAKIQAVIDDFRKTGTFEPVWLGPEKAFDLIRKGASVAEIEALLDEYPYMFSKLEDSDTCRWLAELGMYAPIVHLQQTDGTKSAHLPFDDAHNKTGVIHAEKVLAALDKSDAVPAAPEMPAPCKEHYLTLELFGGTAELPSSLLRKVDVSARYWRNYL